MLSPVGGKHGSGSHSTPLGTSTAVEIAEGEVLLPIPLGAPQRLVQRYGICRCIQQLWARVRESPDLPSDPSEFEPSIQQKGREEFRLDGLASRTMSDEESLASCAIGQSSQQPQSGVG